MRSSGLGGSNRKVISGFLGFVLSVASAVPVDAPKPLNAGVELNRARRGSGEDLVDLSELPGERFLRLLQVNRR